MVSEWPRKQVQTKAAMKKERPLEEKVLADVRDRVSQIKQMLKPALENSSLSSNTTKEAEQTAHAVAKVCVQSVHHLGADTLLNFNLYNCHFYCHVQIHMLML